MVTQTTLSNIAPLGVGIGFREQLKADLFLHRAEVDWLEIVADHFIDMPREKDEELTLLRDHFTLIPHGINLSLGSAEGIDVDYVKKLAKLVQRINPPYWSEHIAFTRAGGVEIGHLSPLPFTYEALDVLQRNIETVRQYIDTPLILENITYIIQMASDMSEAQFLTELAKRTGCFLLLDVTNLYTNAVNLGYDLKAFLDSAPLDKVVQLHFTGGEISGDLLIDSHSAATPEPVWELLDEVVRCAPVKGVLLERDENIPTFSELATELVRARAIGTAYRRWA